MKNNNTELTENSSILNLGSEDLEPKIKDLKAKSESMKKELADLKNYNKETYNDYGSELCVGEMINKESELKEKIELNDLRLAFAEFSQKLIESQKDMEPEFIEALHNNFWKLI